MSDGAEKIAKLLQADCEANFKIITDMNRLYKTFKNAVAETSTQVVFLLKRSYIRNRKLP